MRRCLVRSISALVCCLFLNFAVADGQETEQRPATVRAPVAERPAAESQAAVAAAPSVEFKPEMILLEDPETGQLRQLIGFTLRDFEELSRLKQQRDAMRQPPRYSLQSLSITGTGHAEHAALKVEIKLLANATGWIKVPLRLNEAALMSKPTHTGSGRFFIEAGDAAGGLIAWIECDATDPAQLHGEHTISLDVLAPLRHVAGESRLKLSLPAAPESEVDLTVLTPQAVAAGSEGLARIESRAVNERETRIVGSGLKPDFELIWRQAAGVLTPPAGLLEATAEVLIRIDGRSVRSQADLKIKNSASAFSQFRVRLPKGAELVSGDASGYEIGPVTAVEEDGRGVVDIHLFEPNNVAQVRLVTERSITQQDAPMELAGFEVVDAVRQWGRVAVVVDEQWQAIWGPQSLVRQVESLPETLERDDLAARFEYSGQPYSLTARIVQRRTYIAVEPRYQVDVFADHLDLTATMRYTVRRAGTFQLQVDMANWRLQPDGNAIGPEDVVDVDKIVDTRTRPLILPLRKSVTGPVEIVIRARRELKQDAKSFQFDLPRPDGDFVESATLRLQPATNIELTPRAEQTRGLVRQLDTDDRTGSDSFTQSLNYRGDGPVSTFAADFVIRAQSVAVASKNLVRLDEQAIHVQQSLEFDVAHQPLESVVLLIPRAVAAADTLATLKVTLDGAELAPQRLAEDNADPTGPVRLRVALPVARIGRFDLRVSYTSEPVRVPAEASVPLDVYLVLPSGATATSHELTVMGPEDVNVLTKPDSRWQVDADAGRTNPEGAVLRLANAESDPVVRLFLQSAGRQAAGTTIVDRTYIQTQTTAGRRQDRVVYRFTTDRTTVGLTLPPGLIAGAVRAKLDGRSIFASVNAERKLEVPVPSAAPADGYHTLELDFACDQHSAATGRLQLEAPRWIQGTWFRRTYWQLVLPAYQHLVCGPEDFVHEFQWTWHGAFWRRTPLLDQEQLMSWSGGAAARESLASQTNQYLFSRISTTDDLTVQTVSRSMGVFVASAVALTVGLLLIYVPLARRPVCLVLVAIGLIAATAIAPEPAIMFAQAAGLGFVLALVALASERYLARRRGPKMVVQGTARANHEFGSTERRVPSPVAGSHSSTKSAALVLPAASESKS